MRLTEDHLCELFADKVTASPDFAAWILNQTKFSPFARNARLLHEQQMSIRPRKRWWRHWWCNAPGLRKSGRETDIFMVFEADAIRFALHFENKRDDYKFSEGQAEDYEVRAAHMLQKAEYLNHSDFATVLLATSSFRARFPADCELFDVFISYEDIGTFVPEFRTAL